MLLKGYRQKAEDENILLDSRTDFTDGERRSTAGADQCVSITGRKESGETKNIHDA